MDRARIVAQDVPYDPWPSAMTVNEGYVLYSAKLEREDKFLAIGARGRSPA